MEKLPISVIIAAKNAEKTIGECLSSVQKNNPAEIIVVDGVSSDRTVDIAMRYAERIYSDEGKGFNHAQQLGAEQATQEYIALVDADIILTEGALETMLAELKASDYVSMQAKQLAFKLATYWERTEDQQMRLGQSKPGSRGLSAAVLRKDTVMKYKLDSSLKVASDYHFQMRTKRDGYKLGTSSAFVYHQHNADFKSFAKQRFRYGEEAVQCLKIYGPWHPRLWVPLSTIYSLCACVIKGKPWLVPYFTVNGIAATAGMAKGFFELMGEALTKRHKVLPMINSERYRELYANFFRDDRIQKVSQILSRFQVKRFLDIGCGDGTLTLFFKEAMASPELYGVEIRESVVNSAKEKGINAIQVDLNASSLPFESRFFDVVFAGEIIEHMFDPDRLLEEIHRVLVPSGTLVITTPNLAAWHSRLLLLAGFQPYNVSPSLRFWSAGKLFSSGPAGHQHIRFFTVRALKALLKEHHFAIDWCGGAGTRPFYAPFGLRYLVRAIEVSVARIRPSFASCIIIVAKKLKESR